MGIDSSDACCARLKFRWSARFVSSPANEDGGLLPSPLLLLLTVQRSAAVCSVYVLPSVASTQMRRGRFPPCTEPMPPMPFLCLMTVAIWCLSWSGQAPQQLETIKKNVACFKRRSWSGCRWLVLAGSAGAGQAELGLPPTNCLARRRCAIHTVYVVIRT